MEPKLQPCPDTRSRNNSSPPVSITQPVVESPASEFPPNNVSLVVGDGSEAGLQIHNDHKRGLEEFRSIFNSKMRNKPVKHDHVHVLIWTWGEALDDLKVKEEVDRLEQVFKDRYAFSVQREKLHKLEKASHQLNRYLSSFMEEYDNPNTLLIFYYAGHGTFEDNTLVITGTTAQQTAEEKKRNTIAWSGAEKTIKASQADVFVIFDCCSAGGFGGYDFRAAGDTAFQCLAACGSHERTRKPGNDSFTSALIWALEELRSRHPFTSKALLDKVKQYDKLPKGQTPRLLRREELNDELVWIAPQCLEENEPDAPGSEHRNLTHEYMDLRFKFYRSIRNSDAEIFARHMSNLVNDVDDFQAKHIIVLDKTSTHSRAVRSMTSAIHQKRKRSTSTHSRIHSPTALETVSASPVTLLEPDTTSLRDPGTLQPIAPERRKVADLHVEPKSAGYHLRMALHYMLQSFKTQIGLIADRVLPVREPDDALSDID